MASSSSSVQSIQVASSSSSSSVQSVASSSSSVQTVQEMVMETHVEVVNEDHPMRALHEEILSTLLAAKMETVPSNHSSSCGSSSSGSSYTIVQALQEEYESVQPPKPPPHRNLPPPPPPVDPDDEEIEPKISFQPGEFARKRMYLWSRSPYTNFKRFRLLQLYAQFLGYSDLVLAFGFFFYLIIPDADVPMDNSTIAFLFGASWNMFSSIILYMGVHKKRLLELVKLWFIMQFITLAYATILFTKDLETSMTLTVIGISTYVHKLIIFSYMTYYAHYVWKKQMKQKAIDIVVTDDKV